MSERYHVRNHTLYYGERKIGPDTWLYLDKGDFLGLPDKPGVKHVRLPKRIDIVFVAGTKVVGLESKRPMDLVSSQSARRLARQMRTLRDVVDVPCLFLRGIPIPGYLGEFHTDFLGEPSKPGLWDDLVRLQCLGIVLVPGPTSDEEIPYWLVQYAPTLADERNVLSALAGTDRKASTKTRTKGWFLHGLRGVGPKLAAKLHARFGSTRKALNATDAEWKEVGAGPSVIERRKEAME